MILTEEELELKKRAFSTGVMPTWEFDQVIASHRNLLSANAELSFKNQKYKRALVQIYGVEMGSAEFEREVMFNIARDILKEELK